MVGKNFKIHIILWWIIILFPSLKNFTGSVNFSQKILHVICFSLIAVIILVFNIKITKSKSLFLIIVYAFTIIVYYCLCTVIFTSSLEWVDFIDLTRPMLYLTYFIFPFLFPIKESELKKVVQFLTVLCFVQLIFSSFVYFPSLWKFVDLYKGRLSDDPIIMHFYRWSGTFGYPSDFSFFLSFFIYFTFFEILNNEGKISKKLLLKFVLLVIGLIFTTSRGGIGTVFIVFILLFLFTRVKYRIIVHFMIIISIIFVYWFWQSYRKDDNAMISVDYVLSVFSSDDEVDDSTSHRIYELNLAFNYAKKYFPFGSGSNRIILKKEINVIESFYGYHLMKWGVGGLLLILLSYLYMMKVSYRVGNRYCSDIFLKNFCFSVFLLILSIPLSFGWSSAVSDRFKGLPFFYLLSGYVFMLHVYWLKRDRGKNRKLSANNLFPD